MDWENEYWIRAYVRDSASFKRCSWKAKGLFFLIARRVNAAGRLYLEKDDPEESVASLCEEVEGPWDEIRDPLLELLKTKTVEIPLDWAMLVIPNFPEAQSAKWKESTRKRAYRRRQKDGAQADEDQFEAADPTVLENQIPRAVPPPVPVMPLRPSKGPLAAPGLDTNIESDPQGSVQGSVQGSQTLESIVPNPDADLQGSRKGSPNVTLVDVPNPDTGLQGSPNVTLGDVPNPDADLQGSSGSNRTLGGNVPNPDEMSHTDHTQRPLQRDPSDLSQGSHICASEGDQSQDDSEEPEAPGQLPLLPGQDIGITGKSRKAARIEYVWEHYMGLWRKNHTSGPKPTLTTKRKGQIDARIKQVGLENVITSLERLFQSKWRIESGYTRIDYAIRSAEQMEMILSQDPNDRGRGKGNGKRWTPIQQSSAKPTYRGNGMDLKDGKIYHKDGRVEEIEDDPLGLGIDFAAAAARAKAKKAQ